MLGAISPIWSRMPRSRIMIIRHAEKPVPDRVKGVRARGESDDASLTALGWQRAGALIRFFANPSEQHIVCPNHLFAVRFDLDNLSSSRRSRQTVGPLSKSLGLEVDDRFGEGQEALLVKAVLQTKGNVLIAWSHGCIPEIASLIGGTTTTPEAWPEKRFDLVWVFDLRAGKRTFLQVPQRLLAGDSQAIAPMTGSA